MKRMMYPHVVTLDDSTFACASDVTVGISGHGFLIASDSLTKHPEGPGIEPGKTISTFNLNRGRGLSKKYRSVPQFPSRRQLSPPLHSVS